MDIFLKADDRFSFKLGYSTMFFFLALQRKGNSVVGTERILPDQDKYFIPMSTVLKLAMYQNSSEDLFKNTGHWTLPKNCRIRMSGVEQSHLHFYKSLKVI